MAFCFCYKVGGNTSANFFFENFFYCKYDSIFIGISSANPDSAPFRALSSGIAFGFLYSNGYQFTTLLLTLPPKSPHRGNNLFIYIIFRGQRSSILWCTIGNQTRVSVVAADMQYREPRRYLPLCCLAIWYIADNIFSGAPR